MESAILPGIMALQHRNYMGRNLPIACDQSKGQNEMTNLRGISYIILPNVFT